MTATVLPCGCPSVDSLFDTTDGRQVLIINPPVGEIRPSVWCATELRWVPLSSADYDTLKETNT